MSTESDPDYGRYVPPEEMGDALRTMKTSPSPHGKSHLSEEGGNREDRLCADAGDGGALK